MACFTKSIKIKRKEVNKMKFKKGKLGVLSILLVLALALTGCGGQKADNASKKADSEKQLTKVRLQLKWLPQTQFAGYYVAQEKGYYKDEGIDIEIIPGGPDIVPEQQVSNGAADIGMSWVASLLSHREEGFNITQIAQITQKSGFLLVSKKSSNINSPADLKGKKVGAWFGGLEFEELALLDKYKLDPEKDVKLTKQGYTMDQLINGQIDAAAALSHNEYPMLLESGIKEEDLNVINLSDKGVGMLEDELFANDEWLKNNKETAVKFLRATIKGWTDAVNDPEGATDIVMKLVDEKSTTREHQLYMAKAIAKLVKPDDIDISKITYTDKDSFQKTADIALKFGVIKKKPDISKAYTNEIWESAVKDLK